MKKSEKSLQIVIDEMNSVLRENNILKIQMALMELRYASKECMSKKEKMNPEWVYNITKLER